MDKQDRKVGIEVLMFPTVITALLIVVDYFLRLGAFALLLNHAFLSNLIHKIRQHHLEIRSIFVIFVALTGLASRRIIEEQKNITVLLILALSSGVLFLLGFTSYLYWNLIIYPLSFFGTAYFVHYLVMYITGFKKELSPGIRAINKGRETSTNFIIPTEKGDLLMPLPTYGSYIEGAAGGGKSVLIEQLINQGVRKNYSLFLYDFEGDVTEGGAILSRNVYASLINFKNKHALNTHFAFMNFKDPARSIRCNPLSPKYIKGELDIIEFATTLMTNLNPDWRKKRDFWADNAIAYTIGIIQRLYNDKNLHRFMTIPHLVALCTKSYPSVFKWILDTNDSSLERRIMPLYVAYQEQAKSQIAGAVSSAALPITKLLTKDIFWPLSPEGDEEFDLDITNKSSPICFCIGTIPSQKYSLGPVVSLIALVCMNNMNQLNKHKSLFILDELPTVTIPNIDFLPATARKKGVCAMFAVQSFKQLEEAYGKEKAEIIRDNLSNQFIFKTNSIETAERMVKIFGKDERYEYSMTVGDSTSQTRNAKKEDVLQVRDIMTQKPGHCTGSIAGGDPALFHTQFKYFEMEKPELPPFSQFVNTGDTNLDQDLMLDRVEVNYRRIIEEIDELLRPYDGLEPTF